MVGELRKEVDDLKNRNKVLEEDKNAIGLQRDEVSYLLNYLNLKSCLT